MDTKALRQKILDLAIHGRLVPQDPNDEPASVLLQRIRDEKERLIKEGKIKKGKKSAKTSDTAQYENVPFAVPKSWEWCKIEELCSKFSTGPFGSMVHKSDYINFKGVPLVNPANIINGKIVEDKLMYVSETKATELCKYQLEDNDIIIARRGDLTKCAIFTDSKQLYLCGTGSFFMHLIWVSSEYFKVVYSASYLQSILRKECVGATMDNLNQGVLGNILFPLPPLAEQQRIVSEIERWFSLIDIIESGKESLKSAVKQAKAKILDLAIHGKLVPQDPADEPASDLLRRINPKAEITSDNAQCGNVPKGWCLPKLKDIFTINPKNKEKDEVGAGFVAMTNISDGFSNKFCYEEKPWGSIKSGFTHFSDGDIAVAKISPCLENRKSMILENLPNGIGAGTTELHVFRPLCLSKLFGLYFFKSDYFIKHCVGTFNGVVGQQRVGRNIIEQIDFPLPPLAEQRRIVAKIEQLFAQLDSIEAMV